MAGWKGGSMALLLLAVAAVGWARGSEVTFRGSPNYRDLPIVQAALAKYGEDNRTALVEAIREGLTPEQFREAQFGCGSITDCGACTQSDWICDWCLYTNTCVAKVDPVRCHAPGVSVPPLTGGWIRKKIGCDRNHQPVPGNYSGKGLGIVGCTDPDATNYLFRATIDDGGCTYQPGDARDKFPRDYCVCSDAGVNTPYGHFSGAGYTGGSGQQPCDAMDKCAQVHDWCVGQNKYSSCVCTMFLYKCVKLAHNTAGGGFCGMLQIASTTVLAELSAPVLACEAGNPTYNPPCTGALQCNGQGSCNWSGGCDCNPGWDGYGCTINNTALRKTPF